MDYETEAAFYEVNEKVKLLEQRTKCQIEHLCIKIKELEKKIEKSEGKNSITLEVGKFYKTRNNKKVIIVCYDEARTKYKYVGMIIGDQVIYSWTSNGCFDNEGRNAANDIIGEWEDE